MTTREEQISKDVELFLKSRKREVTRGYTLAIIEYLKSISTVKNQGFVQSKDFIKAMVGEGKIPNQSSFFSLIVDMEKFGLIQREVEKKEKGRRGKPRVYYRIPLALPSMLPDKEAMEKHYDDLLKSIQVVSSRLRAAEYLLGKCYEKLEDPRDVKDAIRRISDKEIEHVQQYEPDYYEKWTSDLEPFAQQYIRRTSGKKKI